MAKVAIPAMHSKKEVADFHGSLLGAKAKILDHLAYSALLLRRGNQE